MSINFFLLMSDKKEGWNERKIVWVQILDNGNVRVEGRKRGEEVQHVNRQESCFIIRETLISSAGRTQATMCLYRPQSKHYKHKQLFHYHVYSSDVSRSFLILLYLSTDPAFSASHHESSYHYLLTSLVSFSVPFPSVFYVFLFRSVGLCRSNVFHELSLVMFPTHTRVSVIYFTIML